MNDELDRLLQNWSAKQKPTPEQLELLEQRVLASLPEASALEVPRRSLRFDVLTKRNETLAVAMRR